MCHAVTLFFLATSFTYSFHMCTTALCSQFLTNALPHNRALQSYGASSVDIKARRFVCFIGHAIVLLISMTDSICWPAAMNN